jgi:hypothetical protein
LKPRGWSRPIYAGSGQHQLFFEPDHDKQKRLDGTFERIREKFGHDAHRIGK